MLCAVGVPYWAHWRRRKSPEPLHLARGALFDGIHAVRQKVGIGRNITICILPDKFQAKSAAYDSSSTASVAMPRCLLERLSRPEIDALAAFQLIWHRTFRFKRYAFFGVLLYGSISSISLYTQGTGARGRWLVFLLQAIAEIVVLRVLWRRHIDGIHLAAMEVSGNPDAYVSAMVELSSLGGGAVDARLLRRLFRIAGSTQRMDAFLVESPRRKEDRYPTSGDYLAVGF
jgi:hypothetical protein